MTVLVTVRPVYTILGLIRYRLNALNAKMDMDLKVDQSLTLLINVNNATILVVLNVMQIIWYEKFEVIAINYLMVSAQTIQHKLVNVLLITAKYALSITISMMLKIATGVKLVMKLILWEPVLLLLPLLARSIIVKLVNQVIYTLEKLARMTSPKSMVLAIQMMWRGVTIQTVVLVVSLIRQYVRTAKMDTR